MPDRDTALVIVNYNSGECLQRCLSSVLASEWPLTVTVVDNDSSDGSLDGVESGEHGQHIVRLIENPSNVGFSRAVNQGLEDVASQYTLLLNPDCQVFPHTVEKLRNTLEEFADAAIVGALVFNEDGTEQRGCRRNEPNLKRSAVTALGLGSRYQGVNRTSQRLPTDVVDVDAVSGAAMMLRTEALKTAGGMDEDYFLHCEDLDICRTMRDLGHRVLFDPHVSVFHRKGGSGKASPLRVEYHKHRGMSTYYLKHRSRRQGALETALSLALVWAHFGVGAISTAGRSLFARWRKPAPTMALPDPAAPRDKRTILVTGAKSDVGDYLLPRLAATGRPVIAVSRRIGEGMAEQENVRWVSLEYLTRAPADDFGPVDVWINLAPIWTTRKLDRAVRRLGRRRIVALSSTSVLGKADSEDPREQEVVNRLLDGERWLEKAGAEGSCTTTVLRPTLLYGGPRNQNINFIRDFIRCFRFFPLVAGGQGLRQPVHADDVAEACVALLERDAGDEHALVLAGGERLPYREMVSRVFDSMGIRVRTVTVPAGLIGGALGVARHIPGLGFLSPRMADRMTRDLVYDTDEGVRELGVNPRGFEP